MKIDDKRMIIIVPTWMIDSYTGTIAFVKLKQREALKDEKGYLGSNGINDYFSSQPYEEENK